MQGYNFNKYYAYCLALFSMNYHSRKLKIITYVIIINTFIRFDTTTSLILLLLANDTQVQ